MIDRDKILEQAYHDCMKEMYARSQPSADYDQLLEDAKNGKIDKDEQVYERYYLSQEEFEYVRNKYVNAYGIKEHWIPDVEVLEDYLKNGGTKDKYIAAHTDEYGYHPGYRGYERVKSIFDQISDILNTYNIDNENVGIDITEAIFKTIKNCKEFYKFDKEYNSFTCSVVLGPSPTSNPEAVKEYWKSQGIDVDIEIRNPLLFWDQDYYGNEFEEIMEDEFGENWKEYWDNKWKEQVKQAELDRKAKIKELLNDV